MGSVCHAFSAGVLVMKGPGCLTKPSRQFSLKIRQLSKTQIWVVMRVGDRLFNNVRLTLVSFCTKTVKTVKNKTKEKHIEVHRQYFEKKDICQKHAISHLKKKFELDPMSTKLQISLRGYDVVTGELKCFRTTRITCPALPNELVCRTAVPDAGNSVSDLKTAKDGDNGEAARKCLVHFSEDYQFLDDDSDSYTAEDADDGEAAGEDPV